MNVNDPDEARLRGALAQLVADPPSAPPPVPELLRRGGRAVRLRRGLAAGGAAVAVVLVAAGVPLLAGANPERPSTPPAAGPGATASAPGSSAAGSSAPGDPRTSLPSRAAPDPTRPEQGPARPAVGRWYPYDLYTHCGIRYARFGGTWWHAVPEQPEPAATADTSGRGEYFGYVAGYMRLTSPGTAEFTSSRPVTSAEFRPFAGEPPLCS